MKKIHIIKTLDGNKKVKLGETSVGFKDDIEQYGTIIAVGTSGMITLECHDDVTGDKYKRTEEAKRCWVEQEYMPPAQLKKFEAERKAARDAAIAKLAEQCAVGNAMIEAGNNSTADHIDATDMLDRIRAAKSLCAGIRAEALEWGGTRKDFVAALVAGGIDKGTAGTQFSKAKREGK